MPREHGERGEFVETVTHADVLAVFDEVRGPSIFSADVADALGCSRETARRKLKELYENGHLARRKKSRRVIYWNTSGERVTPEERAVESDAKKAREIEEKRTGTEAENAEPSSTPGRQAPNTPSGELVDIDSLSFKRDLTPARRKELKEWHYHVYDLDGGVTKSDFKSWWSADRGERTGYGAGSFWEAFAKASMKQSEKFEKPNARTYRWVGDALDGDVYDPTKEF